MGKSRRILRPVWLAWGLSLCLICVSVASADDSTPGDSSSVDDSTNDLPPAGLTGWFFTSDNPPAYPVETDPGEPWTSPENIATLNYWLSLVVELGDDPSLLQELYGLGMITAPDAAAVAAAETLVAQTLGAYQEIDTQDQGVVPEPAPAASLCGALVLLGLYAAARISRFGHGLDWPPGWRGLLFKDGSL